MPQYHVGHVKRIAVIEQLVREQPSLQLCGAAYRGVGIPQCVRDGAAPPNNCSHRCRKPYIALSSRKMND